MNSPRSDSSRGDLDFHHVSPFLQMDYGLAEARILAALGVPADALRGDSSVELNIGPDSQAGILSALSQWQSAIQAAEVTPMYQAGGGDQPIGVVTGRTPGRQEDQEAARRERIRGQREMYRRIYGGDSTAAQEIYATGPETPVGTIPERTDMTVSGTQTGRWPQDPDLWPLINRFLRDWNDPQADFSLMPLARVRSRAPVEHVEVSFEYKKSEKRPTRYDIAKGARDASASA